MPTTFVKKNPETGALHAYRYTGSHFDRRCGTRGIEKTVYSGANVTKVSVDWFFNQSNACPKCQRTFDEQPQPSSGVAGVTESLQEIAEEITE